MLAGYLPFDDDPANPDGDNINLLYKYIVTTPLTFPEYVTPHARDLLRRILVPDPRKRADLFEVARHSWLSEYSHIVSHITSSTTQVSEIANTTVPVGMLIFSPLCLCFIADDLVRRTTKRAIVGAQCLSQGTPENLPQSRSYSGWSHPPCWGYLAGPAIRQIQDFQRCQTEDSSGGICRSSISDRPRRDSYRTQLGRFEYDANRSYAYRSCSRATPRRGARGPKHPDWRLQGAGSRSQHSWYRASSAFSPSIPTADHRWFHVLVQCRPVAVAGLLRTTRGSYSCCNQCSGSTRAAYKQAIRDLCTYPSGSDARCHHVHRTSHCSAASIQIQHNPSARDA